MLNAYAKLKITSKGKTPLQHLEDITEKIHFELQNELIDLAEKDAQRMKELINERGYKLQKLSNAIDVNILNTTAGVDIGIGNILNFPKNENNEDYWQAFNNGFKPGAHGKLVPLGSFEGKAPNLIDTGEEWQKGNGSWTFPDTNTFKKPVEPILFVDIAGEELLNNTKSTIIKFLTTSG